jgi:alpha-tubulin suppressor-like RCC1 family protein
MNPILPATSVSALLLLSSCHGADAPYAPAARFLSVADTVRVPSEGKHACALYGAGRVMCWGSSNAFGQLGNGTTAPQHSAVLVSGVENATSVSAGDGFSCARLADSTVVCWGLNADGQLGNGGKASSSVPIQVAQLSNATAVSAGGRHACARLADSTIQCWGSNRQGELGDGTRRDSSVPVPVSGIATATAVTSGASHTCARLADSTLQCWGHNAFGQLGNGTRSSAPTPRPVSGLSSATAVAAGSFHTCARLGDSKVRCWGLNRDGQLGDGTKKDSAIPVVVAGLVTAAAVTAGSAHACALLRDGGLACWGSNAVGQLGDGTGSDSRSPVGVAGIATAVEVVAGDFFTCARLNDLAGPIHCWGSNAGGQIQPGAGPGIEWVPLLVGRRTLNDVRDIALGGSHTCALWGSGSSVRCWGENASGQLGNGTTQSSSDPVAVSGLSTATALASGRAHSCARLADGTVGCWGDNVHGQLGDGTTESSPVPVAVSGIANATGVAAGGGHSCARLADATVRCWGDNADGQLGDGTFDPSSAPVAVGGLIAVTAVAAGGAHTCALLIDGTVTCWGDDGTTTGSAAPQPVAGIAGATAIAAGGDHTCALVGAPGSAAVQCWGRNDSGQLGDGTTTSSSTPLAVPGISTASAIAAGRRHTCALLSDYTVRCWGENGQGQLGDGTLVSSSSARSAVGLPAGFPVTHLSLGDGHSCVRQSDSTIRCWGSNAVGQLGNGHRPWYAAPAPLDCVAMDVARTDEPQSFTTSDMANPALNGLAAILDIHRVRPLLPPGCSATSAVVLIHGRANEATSTFDNTVLPERSTMHDLAMAGIDAYSVNLFGYGRSKLAAPNSDPMASACNGSLRWCTHTDVSTCTSFVPIGTECDGTAVCNAATCVPVTGVCDCPGSQDATCAAMGQQARTLMPNPLSAPCPHTPNGGKPFARTVNHAADIGRAVDYVRAQTGLPTVSILSQAYSAIPLGYWLGAPAPEGSARRAKIDKVIFNAGTFPISPTEVSRQATYSLNSRTYSLTLDIFPVAPPECYAEEERQEIAEGLFVALKARDDVTSADPVWGPQTDPTAARRGTYRIPTNGRWGFTVAEAARVTNRTLVLYGVRDTGGISASQALFAALPAGNKLLTPVRCSSHLGWLERCMSASCLQWPGPHSTYSQIVGDFVQTGQIYSDPGLSN